MGPVGKLRKLCRVLSVAPWRGAFLRHRVAASSEHVAALSGLGGCRTVVDIGANRGQFSLAVRYVLPGARIVAFEPLPGPAERFREVFAGQSMVQLVEAAVGPKEGESEIHVAGRDDSSSLLPITSLQDELFPGTACNGSASVRMTRLESAVAEADVVAPALLKLDVQGFELNALHGCEALLQQFTWVYVECSFVELYESQALADEVVGWLRDRGFRIGGIYNLSRDRTGRAVQADFLFERR